jgi:hypothetical protein
MKQAEHCGFGSTPMLNHTGLLKESFWCRSRWVRSSRRPTVLGRREVAAARRPSATACPTTRPISWRTLRSRAGVPMAPRKYFDATTFVASCDQLFGTSMSRCSKTVSPPSPEMTAERISHSTVS